MFAQNGSAGTESLQFMKVPRKTSTEIPYRTKFAAGHFLTGKQDGPKSFPELAKRCAPGLREVCFAWPGLLNGRACLHKRENGAGRIMSDLKYRREHGMKAS